jgi:hypothetical protein
MHQNNSMQLVIIEKHMLFNNMFYCTMERLHKFANSPSLQSLLMLLLMFLDLGSSSFVDTISSTPNEYFFHLFLKHHLLTHLRFFQTHIHFHVLEIETPKCPRATNLSSSFSIHSLLIFPT